MPIFFRNNADLFKLKQNPYSLLKRDQNAADSILNLLVKQKRVTKVLLGKPSAAVLPAFIV